MVPHYHFLKLQFSVSLGKGLRVLFLATFIHQKGNSSFGKIKEPVLNTFIRLPFFFNVSPSRVCLVSTHVLFRSISLESAGKCRSLKRVNRLGNTSVSIIRIFEQLKIIACARITGYLDKVFDALTTSIELIGASVITELNMKFYIDGIFKIHKKILRA